MLSVKTILLADEKYQSKIDKKKISLDLFQVNTAVKYCLFEIINITFFLFCALYYLPN